MGRLDELPADQRAVLGLLLKQGRTYSQIAGLLRLEDRAVRERALDALDALGPQDDALAAEDQDLVADYLLGQADGPAREEAQALLDESPPAREWAHAVAGALEGLAPAGSLPELPEGPAAPTPEPTPEPVAAAPAATPVVTAAEAPDATSAAEPAPAPAPVSATAEPAAAPAATGTSSRSRTLGTALIIGAAVVAVIGIIITLSGGFSGGDDTASTDDPVAAATATTTATAASTTSTTAAGRVDKQVELAPVNRGSSALGIVQISSAGSQRAIAVAAQDLSPGYYALWLSNSASDVRFVGFGPRVVATGDSAGRLAGNASLDVDPGRYRSVVLARQTVTAQNVNDRPTRPGTIVLRGQLK